MRKIAGLTGVKFVRLLYLSSIAVFSCKQSATYSRVQLKDGLIREDVLESQTKLVKSIDKNCSSGCHGTNEVPIDTLKDWATQAASFKKCLDGKPADQDKINDCIKDKPVRSLGIYRAYIKDKSFKDMYEKSGQSEEHMRASTRSIMPTGAPANVFGNEAEAVLTLLLDDVPAFKTIAKIRGEKTQIMKECVENISPALTKHVEDSTSGALYNWSLFHKDQRTKMFGCPGDGFPRDPLKCLETFPEKTAWSGTSTKLRLLRTLPPKTSYWMRTSANGRFIGNGGNLMDEESKTSYGAAIDDLEIADRRIGVTASFDPYFSPDLKRFMFVGTICPASLLTNVRTTGIDTSDALTGCQDFNSNITTYQSLGMNISKPGQFNVVTPAPYKGDDGGSSFTEQFDPVSFGETNLTITTFEKGAGNALDLTVKSVVVKGESQTLMSPSSNLVINRFGIYTPNNDEGGAFALRSKTLSLLQRADDDSKYTGYHMYFLRNMLKDGGAYSASDDVDRSTICIKGNKATVSFDDRFIVTHHYADKSEDAMNAGKYSNILLYDLLTKKSYQITKMPAGAYALFPNFRADGWIYFLVRDHSSGNRVDSIIASDAAIRAANGTL